MVRRFEKESVEKVVTFYGQPPSATCYIVKFVLLVCLFSYLLSFFFLEILFLAYFILVLLPNVNVNLKSPKVVPWYWLGVLMLPIISCSSFFKGLRVRLWCM